MSDPISREELRAIIETQSKATEQMVLVAKSLSDILVEQRRLSEKLSNGVMKEFTQTIVDHVASCTESMREDLKNACVRQDKVLDVAERAQTKVENDIPEIKRVVISMSDDIKFSKWFIGAVGLVIIVATVLLRGLDSRMIDAKNIKMLTTAIHEAEQEVHK